MDGFSLLNGLRQVLSEATTSTWPDIKFSYDLLYQAAVMTASRTNVLISSQAITTVDGTSTYNLNPNFHRLYLMDDQNRYFIKVYDGANYHFKYWVSPDSIYLANNLTEVAIPDSFTIAQTSALAQKTGTVTSTGTLANTYTLFGETLGESTLTDSAANFSTVKVGDLVHNTTDGSHGIVISITSTTAIVCALFYGTQNYFDSSAPADAYIINPQARYQLILDPPCSTSGYTVTVPYIAKPDPVYSYYARYNFPAGYEQALIQYAAWLYKYRDREPNQGDTFFKNWLMMVTQLNTTLNQGMKRGGFGVNFVKRGGRSWTYR